LALIHIKQPIILYNYLFVLLILWVSELILSYILYVIQTKLRNILAFDLNFNILEHVKRLPFTFFKDIDSTYLNQRINSDSFTVTSFVLDNILNLIIRILTLLVALYVIFSINVYISIIFLAILPLYTLAYFIFKKPLYKAGYIYKEEQNKFFAKINEQLYNIKLIKVNSWYEVLSKKLKFSFKFLFRAAMNYSKLTFLFSNIDKFIGYLANIILFFYGGSEIINNKLSIGDFIILNSYSTILLGSISYIFNFGKTYQDTLISYNRIKEILDTKIEINGNLKLESISKIEFENISFSYNSDTVIFNNVNYQINKGNIYCIIGDNGAGKSTFINLLLGLIQDYEGSIKYNSYNINELDLYYIREKLFGVTEQEPTLLNDTIINNISYGLNKVNMQNVEDLCKKLDVYKYIINLPNGFNSNIIEKSSNISGGEKQKISQIRSFIKNTDVLIFDEPTSALDNNSIMSFCSLLQEIKSQKIIILVTHNKSLLNIADVVINIK
jgi:ABC-type bacteriocin/lantibiotic exporter with double-glycine peptidase domain